MGDAGNPGQVALENSLRRFESVVQFLERVLSQDARRPTGAVHFEPAQVDEVGGEFERARIDGPDMAVDASCDDGVFPGDPVEILPRGEASLGPLRFVPIDSYDPIARWRSSRGLSEPAQCSL